ncbi:MAG: hypothetical protein ACLU9S_21515 [Oscillospiraceae bacterium]
MPLAALFGGARLSPGSSDQISEWPQNARGAIACDAVYALALSPEPEALLTVDSISRKFKFRQVKTAAGLALGEVARKLGLSPEELADRIVPDLGFGEDLSRVFSYRPRSYTVTLSPALELEVTDGSGKRLKNMPAPGKNDDPRRRTSLCRLQGRSRSSSRPWRPRRSCALSRLSRSTASGARRTGSSCCE